jgi:hypothetical protein
MSLFAFLALLSGSIYPATRQSCARGILFAVTLCTLPSRQASLHYVSLASMAMHVGPASISGDSCRCPRFAVSFKLEMEGALNGCSTPGLLILMVLAVMTPPCLSLRFGQMLHILLRAQAAAAPSTWAWTSLQMHPPSCCTYAVPPTFLIPPIAVKPIIFCSSPHSAYICTAKIMSSLQVKKFSCNPSSKFKAKAGSHRSKPVD